MSELRFETITMPAALLGPENPLPPLLNQQDLHQVTASEGVPQDMLENSAYGHLPNILPYTIQDGYSRKRSPREFKVAILENDILKATFLLDYGGRLWSLFHKPSARELLSVNPVFQPANLALRNAWFSGGVEWNIGTIGHTPFTCAPLFASRVETPRGTPVLRLYEWERVRQVTYQLDIYLPHHSPMLYVYARIINPHQHDVAMYWWSNMAVPESPDTRVLAPAHSAYRFDYQGLRVVPMPEFDGTDRSYSTVSKQAVDYFFHLDDNQRPWVCALDKDGKGLIQTSSGRLKGRKLFLWGTAQGGNRWQEFLSAQGTRYLEIQAGLARTQLEHLKMPANTTWDWLEGYGLLEANSDAVHSKDWSSAIHNVETKLEELSPQVAFEAELERCRNEHSVTKEILHTGSGWGYLEKLRREQSGEMDFAPGLKFSSASLGLEQAPWLTLLNTGLFPKDGFDPYYPAFMVQTQWQTLLETALQKDPHNWAGWLHLGVMHHYRGDLPAATKAWETSLSQKETPWALRNLAVLERQQNNLTDAVKYYLWALSLNTESLNTESLNTESLEPDLIPLAIECGETMLLSGQNRAWLDVVQTFSDSLKGHGRIRFIEARAALAESRLDIVQRFFDDEVEIADLREGATLLTDLWYGFQVQRVSLVEGSPVDTALMKRVENEFPIPKQFDFRMLES
jgi:tetratricopeptide (TPR) repeat protein